MAKTAPKPEPRPTSSRLGYDEALIGVWLHPSAVGLDGPVKINLGGKVWGVPFNQPMAIRGAIAYILSPRTGAVIVMSRKGVMGLPEHIQSLARHLLFHDVEGPA